MKTSQMRVGILAGTVAALLSVSPAFAAAPTSTAPSTPPVTAESKPTDKQSSERWSDRVFDEFQEMQQRMDRLFNEATREVNQHTDWFEGTDFTSSVRLSEDHDNYIVHLSLPDRDMTNVDAKLEGNNALRITAKEEKKEPATSAAKGSDKNAHESIYELGRYEQLLTLPGSADASKMKVDRSGSTVTITIPKSEPRGNTHGQN